MKQIRVFKRRSVDIASLQARVRHLEIQVKRLFASNIAGNHQSTNRGIGFDFDQLREYSRGDDVRFIDWKAFARCHTPMIRVYREDRSRTCMVAIDVSASLFFASRTRLKYELACEVAAVVALIAAQYQDGVGVMLFSETVELYIPIGKGPGHTRRLIDLLCAFEPQGTRARFGCISEQMAAIRRKDMVLFIVSDMIIESDAQEIRAISYAVPTTIVRILDPNELALPAVGFVTVVDSETDEQVVVDLRSKGSQYIKKLLSLRAEVQRKEMRTWGIDCITISDETRLVDDLVKYFKGNIHKPR